MGIHNVRHAMSPENIIAAAMHPNSITPNPENIPNPT